MAKAERVLRISGTYYRKEGISEKEFHDFLSYRHGVESAKIHEKYGILKYEMVSYTPPFNPPPGSLSLLPHLCKTSPIEPPFLELGIQHNFDPSIVQEHEAPVQDQRLRPPD